MAFPTTITDITLLPVSTQGRTRPYVSSGGNVYFLAKDGGTTTQLNAFKATDPTDSFSQAAVLAIANSGVLLGIGTYQDGDDLHIATQDDNDVLLYHIFSMSSDTFTTSNEAVTSAVGTNVDDEKAIVISLETGGDILIGYQGASENVSGQKERVQLAYKTGGSWTVDQPVSATGVAVNFFLGGMVRGEADKFHFVYKDDTNTNAKHKSVQDVDGTLSTAEDMNGDPVDPIDFAVVQPTYHDKSGVERITGAWVRESTNNTFSSYIDDDASPGSGTDVGRDPHFASEVCALSIAIDDGTDILWYLYSEGADQDVFKIDRDNIVLGTNVEVLDAVTCNLLTSNIYTRGANIVLAFVYDDGGTIKYTESNIRLAAASGSGAHLNNAFNF